MVGLNSLIEKEDINIGYGHKDSSDTKFLSYPVSCYRFLFLSRGSAQISRHPRNSKYSQKRTSFLFMSLDLSGLI